MDRRRDRRGLMAQAPRWTPCAGECAEQSQVSSKVEGEVPPTGGRATDVSPYHCYHCPHCPPRRGLWTSRGIETTRDRSITAYHRLITTTVHSLHSLHSLKSLKSLKSLPSMPTSSPGSPGSSHPFQTPTRAPTTTTSRSLYVPILLSTSS